MQERFEEFTKKLGELTREYGVVVSSGECGVSLEDREEYEKVFGRNVVTGSDWGYEYSNGEVEWEPRWYKQGKRIYGKFRVRQHQIDKGLTPIVIKVAEGEAAKEGLDFDPVTLQFWLQYEYEGSVGKGTFVCFECVGSRDIERVLLG